jgi:DNA-binding beta-propeller fold protein YncE
VAFRSPGRRRRLALAALTLAIAAAAVAGLARSHGASPVPTKPYKPRDLTPVQPTVLTPKSAAPAAVTGRSPGTRHYEYVFPDGEIVVYDIDDGNRLVERIRLPSAQGIRGVVVDVRRRLLYVSYGGDGGGFGNGSMLKYDLMRDRVIWQKNYRSGIDSMAITRDGRKIYLPTGEDAWPSKVWDVVDARTGNVVRTIKGGSSPHNTVLGLSGRYVYLGGRDMNWLVVASTRTDRVVKRIGPLREGVRPFTVNGRETLSYTTATEFLGFQVGDLRTGKVLYTVPIRGFTWNPKTFVGSAPSHGVSLSPDEKELWVMDGPNSAVHIFDVSRVPARAPVQVATIRLTRPIAGLEDPCKFDCARSGWLQHTRDGRFVYVGDSGNVISTTTRKIVADLDPLYASKKYLELDWRGGVPVFTTTRTGLGYVR